MSTRSVTVTVPPEKVWEVLADGWLFPLWVVGATRMRAVDEGWPAVGTQLHHSVGSWPLVIDDTTSSLACEPGSRLELQARAWPAGEARVVLRLTPVPEGTEVTIEEDADSGPALLVPRPLRSAMLAWRNTETLRRLASLVEGRA